MLKRTKGIVLLMLLVLTGLAGRVFSETISSKERKFVLDHLKDSKSYFLKNVKGLSEAQLNFKASPERWSIKECIQHITLAEGDLWNWVDATLKKPANPEKRNEVKRSDEQVISMLENRSQKAQAPESIRPEKATWKTTEETLDAFKEKRAALIKYAKTTTDDMRNHISESPYGHFDSYQIVLLLSAHTRRHTQQIEEIKANPSFPK